MADLEIHRMLTLSTAHIQESTANLFDLNTDDLPIFYEKGTDDGDTYGWFIPIVAGEPFPHTCPTDLLAIRALAESQGCDWIMLDRDGDTTEALPTWEW